ncbi:MAG TPA: DEAD/DEAH box helicase, partial [Chthoniobacteraceae bacterium]
MSFEIAISPSGRLSLERIPEATPAVEERWVTRCAAAFEGGSAQGLLFLAGEALALPLPASPTYWRDFARLFLQRLCQTNSGDVAIVAVPEPGEEELETLAQEAPPMRGAEFFGPDHLRRLWQELGEFVANEVSGPGLGVWLAARNPHWRMVGRVTFHLAENKRDQARPFAFLATYTHRLSQQGKPQHIPIARALQEYAGAKQKALLEKLLAPVQKAAEKSEMARELIESRRLFQPLAWSPREAHRFLHDIPAFEESGLVVRVPDWWKKGRPARPQVNIRIGEKKGSLVGLNSLMDFKVEMALDGEPLSQSEWKTLMTSEENLVLLKGQWVEIDRQRLKQVLEHWRAVEKTDGAISFLEGMRMLSGLGRSEGDDGEMAPEAREWSQVVPGEWLREMLASMRDPSTIREFDPGRDLQATLRAYQRTGVHWLWFMTKLGLGACLADDMGLGKTIQTIALLLQLKREGAGKKDSGPSLLIAPASLLANWKSEISRFAPALKAVVVHPSETAGASKKENADPAKSIAGCDLAVTTYGMLTRFDWLRKRQWRLCILDEAQAIKNPSSRQTRAVKEVKAGGRIALTGTPIENRLGDLWSLFDYLCPGLLGGSAEFSRTVKKLTGEPGRHFAPLRNLTQPYILRRLKTDRSIINDLPDKTEVTAWCGLSKAQAALYERSVKELAQKLGETTGIQRRGLVLSFLMRFKQICNHPSHWMAHGEFDPAASGKFTRLREITEEIAARQEKALVFTQFREMTGPL